MKGRSKKNQKPPFKITPKIESDENQIQELQIKKKILEEKYLISKNSCEKTKQDLAEFKQRLMDRRNIKESEINKFLSIRSDFDNQNVLVKKNYKAKIENLQQIEKEKIQMISSLNVKMEEMKMDHNKQMDLKNKMSVQIRNNMDELSKFFSTQLSDIQNSLQTQIDKISNKWETNITEHLKKYEEHVKKYEINKEK